MPKRDICFPDNSDMARKSQTGVNFLHIQKQLQVQ